MDSDQPRARRAARRRLDQAPVHARRRCRPRCRARRADAVKTPGLHRDRPARLRHRHRRDHRDRQRRRRAVHAAAGRAAARASGDAVAAQPRDRRRPADVAPGNALDWMQRARSFEAVADGRAVDGQHQFRRPRAGLPGRRARERTVLHACSATPMLHGRAFLPQEYQRGGPRVAILEPPVVARAASAAIASIVGRRCASTRTTPTPSSA